MQEEKQQQKLMCGKEDGTECHVLATPSPESYPSKHQAAPVLQQEFRRVFQTPPFPLTAAKMEHLVRMLDAGREIQWDVFYPALLHRECGLLLPLPVLGFDGRYAGMLDTWVRNTEFFRCLGIGEMINCYEKMRYENACCQISR